jgi:hypothetical protein
MHQIQHFHLVKSLQNHNNSLTIPNNSGLIGASTPIDH